jgi:hypothetical protein
MNRVATKTNCLAFDVRICHQLVSEPYRVWFMCVKSLLGPFPTNGVALGRINVVALMELIFWHLLVDHSGKKWSAQLLCGSRI